MFPFSNNTNFRCNIFHYLIQSTSIRRFIIIYAYFVGSIWLGRCAVCYENDKEAFLVSKAENNRVNCGHPFCLTCIDTIYQASEQEGASLECPICRRKIDYYLAVDHGED